MSRHFKETAALDDLRQRTISEINSLAREEFIGVTRAVFEHSPWVAETAWSHKPFASVEQLHRAMCKTVNGAGAERQLALIRAHPDLAGRLAAAGQLTRESASEQSSAGLDRLSPEEIDRFEKKNAAYKQRFDFPFVICARLSKKEVILSALERRLQNSREQELKTALNEIFKIAELRLKDLIAH